MENFYQEFTMLVESESYNNAIDFFLETQQSSDLSYEDFKAEAFAYKNFADYFNYASALSDFSEQELKSLDSLNKLEKVPTDFLETAQYLEEINDLLYPFQGVYECGDKYIIAKGTYVYFAIGESPNSLLYSFIEDGEVKIAHGLSIEEFCAATDFWWDIYYQDGTYYAGNGLAESKDSCVFEFSIDKTDETGEIMTITCQDIAGNYNSWTGTYEKVMTAKA